MCWYCGKPVTYGEPIGRSLRCEFCGKDLRACMNCRHYLSGSRSDCAESGAENQKDKETANFCDWFSLNPKFREATAGSKAAAASATAKTAFEDLFK